MPGPYVNTTVVPAARATAMPPLLTQLTHILPPLLHAARFVYSQAGGGRQQHRRLFQRLSRLLGVKMAVVALVAAVTAAGVKGLCLSDW